MLEHTLGPWRIEKPEDELVKFGLHCIGERPTVEIWADGKYAAGGFYHPVALVADNDLANARLIAAAPDLLKALEGAVAYADRVASVEGMPEGKQATRLTATAFLDDGLGPTAVFDVAAARSAISKAKPKA